MSNTQEINQFRDYLLSRLQKGTVDTYVYALESWFSSSNGDGLTPAYAQKYIDELSRQKKSPSTVSTKAHAIMRWFRWKGQDVRLDCPTIRLGEPEYLSMKEVNRIIDSCQTQLEKTLVVVLFDTAVRISELINLIIEDIDQEGSFISVVRKGGKREEVNISEKGMLELKKWLRVRKSNKSRVFMNIQYYDAWRLIKKVGTRVGIKLHPHMFRHSRAIQMLIAGSPLHDVQMHLGHKSIATTANIYGRFKAVDLKNRIPSWQ